MIVLGRGFVSNFYCFCLLGTFGRRASDGGANLHIYYPANNGGVATTGAGQQMDAVYVSPTGECVAMAGDQYMVAGKSGMISGDVNNSVVIEGNDESNDEIKR